MRQPTKQLYEFGPFRLDPVERVLYIIIRDSTRGQRKSSSGRRNWSRVSLR